MSHVLEFPSLDFSRSKRQSWMLAFQGLHPGQLVGTHELFARFDQFGGLPIDLTDRCDGFYSERINWRRQPVPDQMGLEIPFLSRRAA